MTLLLLLIGAPQTGGAYYERQRAYWDYTEWERRKFEEQLILIMAGWQA